MANFVQDTQLRTLNLGHSVVKAAANLPQSTTATIFTVSGGNVLITSLVGQVSGTAIQNQACTVSIGITPTTGTANNSGIATAGSVTNLEVGTMFGAAASSGLAGALVKGAHAGDAIYPAATFVAPAGSITWTTNASNTGKVAWYCTYLPLDDGASVS